ncbi:hypothetical protein TeGR_g119, partial [Tetraparma gracilis]
YIVVLDAAGFGLRSIPSMAFVRLAVALVGDHYPKRLGGLVMVNLGKPSLLFWNMVKPMVPEVVREKVTIVGAKEGAAGRAVLALVGRESAPARYGGLDAWEFDAEEYFGADDWTDEESLEYREALPHYAD